jgi:ATP-dependent Clp protease, protease subunit
MGNNVVKQVQPGAVTEDISLERNGVFLLMGPVDTELVRPAIEWILKASFMDEPFEYLTLIVNSPGGSLSDAFALIDVMKGSKIPVRTLGVGEICSAGLLIFMSGERGERTLTPNTMILSHQFDWWFGGKDHELMAGERARDICSQAMLSHYKKCTGMSLKQIKEILLPASDQWLTAKDAKRYRLCDRVKATY